MKQNKKIIKGKIIGGERFPGTNHKQTLQISIEQLPYKIFKKFLIKEQKVEIKILE